METKFFRIDETKPYSVEGDHNLFNIILMCVGSVFIVFGFLIYLSIFYYFLIPAIIIISIFSVVGLTLFSIGLAKIRKSKKEGPINDIIRNGLATEGIVTDFVSIEFKIDRHSGGIYSEYRIFISYSFIDNLGVTRNDSLCITRLEVPKCYPIGKKIMVAFNDNQSLILKRYTILAEYDVTSIK